MSETDRGYVYTLSDPRTGEPRYVGATIDPDQRYRNHLAYPHSEELREWIDGLREDGVKPEMPLVRVTSADSLRVEERKILKQIADSFDVLNIDMAPNYTYSSPAPASNRAEATQKTTSGIRLSTTDRNVLTVLDGGRATAAFVADELGISRQYASDRLRRFEEHGVTEKIAPALYDLRDDPRAEGGQ